MAKRQGMSKGEMDVARVLWEIGPAPVRTIHEALTAKLDIDFATVQTYLRRLETKGYASSELDGRTRIYTARRKPRTVIRETVDELVQRLFGGQTMPLMRHLIEDHGVSSQDIAELRELIDQLEKEHKHDK